MKSTMTDEEILKLARWVAQNTMRLHLISIEMGFMQSLGDGICESQKMSARSIVDGADRLIQAIDARVVPTPVPYGY